jgi:hypothetical protein
MENVATAADSAAVNPGAQNHHVEEVIRRTEQELRQLMKERVEVTKRIRVVKQTIIGLANLFGDATVDPALLALIGRHNGSRQGGR